MLARWTIRPRLMGVAGVANVSIWGQRERQLQVQVDPEQLRDERRDARAGHQDGGQRLAGVSPLSFLEASTPGHRRLHRHAQPAAADPATSSPIDHAGPPRPGARRGHRAAGGPLRLGEVADGRRGPPAADRRRRRQRRHGPHARRREVPGANTLEVTARRRRGPRRAAARPGRACASTATSSAPPTTSRQATDNLAARLIAGCCAPGRSALLVVVLRSWRTALVAARRVRGVADRRPRSSSTLTRRDASTRWSSRAWPRRSARSSTTRSSTPRTSAGACAGAAEREDRRRGRGSGWSSMRAARCAAPSSTRR